MWFIDVPAGHVLFVGGWRKWVPVLVVWFTRQFCIELRHPWFTLMARSRR